MNIMHPRKCQECTWNNLTRSKLCKHAIGQKERRYYSPNMHTPTLVILPCFYPSKNCLYKPPMQPWTLHTLKQTITPKIPTRRSNRGMDGLLGKQHLTTNLGRKLGASWIIGTT